MTAEEKTLAELRSEEAANWREFRDAVNSWMAYVSRTLESRITSLTERLHAIEAASSERLANSPTPPSTDLPVGVPEELQPVAGMLRVAEPRPGVYFLILDREVVYVGQSQDVPERLKAHRKEARKAFDYALYMPCPSDSLLDVEAYWITKLRPKHNGVVPESRVVSRNIYVPHYIRNLTSDKSDAVRINRTFEELLIDVGRNRHWDVG